MANISTENINTLAQLAASISDGDYIYIYKATSNSFARIEKSVFMQAITGGSVASDVVKSNVDSIVDKLNELISNLANYALLDEVSQMADLDWEDGGGDEPAVDTPVLTSPSGSINVGTLAYNESTIIKTVTVKGNYLTQSLSISVSGEGFSVSTQTISAANANNGTTVSITYTNSGAGDGVTKQGSLTISSSEVSKTITLTAKKNQQSVQPSDYIQDGLILHLDGLSQGSESNKWIDTIGNKEFVLEGGATVVANGVTFDANGEIGKYTGTNPNWMNDGCTIEVCFTPLSGFYSTEEPRVLFGNNTELGIAAVYATAGAGPGFSYGMVQSTPIGQNITKRLADAPSGFTTLSMNSAQFVINSITNADTLYQGRVGNSSDAALTIGGIYRTSGWNPRYANAMSTIHEVRIYNRLLSDSEMKQNQQYDLIKYGAQ